MESNAKRTGPGARRRAGRAAALACAITPVAVTATAAQAPPADRQIEWAVAAAPERLRATAAVLGFAPDGRRITLRPGTGTLVCLADDPAQPNHHVSCYHRDLEPFMKRGRELRAAGLGEAAVDSARLAEIKSGKLAMPAGPTALYQLIAPAGNADPATGVVRDARALSVLYIPYATAESTGLSLVPVKGPWLMDPGTPWAHVMITP